MTNIHKHYNEAAAHAAPRVREWQVVAGFALGVSRGQMAPGACILEPIAQALKPFAIEDYLLCEMSTAVNDAGEELCSDCADGSLDCVTVRVQVSDQVLHGGAASHQDWHFYLNKQLASSESDNLAGPCATIDLHVYQAP